MSLTDWGWDDKWAASFAALGVAEWVPARVVRGARGVYTVRGEAGEWVAETSGKFRHRTTSRADFPAVGDWVAIEQGIVIQAILPRRSRFSRKQPGEKTEEQIVAANVDTVFLVCGLDGDYNPRRIERYLGPAWDSGARPVLLLNKADVRADALACVQEIESLAAGVPVHLIAACDGTGFAALESYLRPGHTIALVGSSGAGKSTLINRLLGEERLVTGDVRATDSRGRHTTSHRELLRLPGGTLMIDNPGLRELQLWSDEVGLEAAFEDVDALAVNCRFRDCRHGNEPGCAVQAALTTGVLPMERYESYLKLRRELAFLARQQDQRAQLQEKSRGKKVNRDFRQRLRAKSQE